MWRENGTDRDRHNFIYSSRSQAFGQPMRQIIFAERVAVKIT